MKRIFVCLLLAAPSLTMATDLTTVYHLAVDSDPTLKAQEASFKASKQSVPLALSQFFPTLSVQAATTGIHARTRAPVIGTVGIFNEVPLHYNSKNYSLNLSQPLFHTDHWSALGQAKHVYKQALATYLAANQDLIIRVSEQYFAVLGAYDDVNFTKSQVKAFSRQLDQAQQRFDVGLIAITDVHEAQARHDSAKASEIAAENTLSDQYEKMSEITGTPSDELKNLKTPDNALLASPQPNLLETWVDIAQIQNLDIQAAKEASLSAKSEITNRIGGYFPQVDLNGSLQKSKGQPPFDVLLPQKSIGLNFSMPLFEGGRTTFRVKEAQARYEEALQKLDLQRRAVLSQTRQKYRGVLTQISQVKSLAQAVRSNQSALKATRAAYEVGTRTVVDVLDAETNLLRAERDHAKARYTYVLEGLRLKRAAGTLKAEDIYTLNQLLQK